jgi:ankyrin repeat protein
MAPTPPPIDAITESLFAAIRAKNLSRVESALAAGANVNGDEVHEFAIDRTVYEGSNTPLMLAIRLRQPAIVERLLAVPGIDVNRGSCFAGENPLIITARQADIAMAERLLAARADPNCEDRYERCTAAGWAIRAGSEALALRLIEAGTDLARHGERLLTLARHFGHKAVITRLTAQGAGAAR